VISITPNAFSEPQVIPELRRRELALLAASLVVAAAVGSVAEPEPYSKRSGFRIGVTAIGGPDGIGGPPSRLQSAMGLGRELREQLLGPA
jgi:hypothetical protein